MRVITIDALYGLQGRGGLGAIDTEAAYRRLDEGAQVLTDLGIQLTHVGGSQPLPYSVYTRLAERLESLERGRDRLLDAIRSGQIQTGEQLVSWKQDAEKILSDTRAWVTDVEHAFRAAGITFGRSKWLYPLFGVGATLVIGGLAAWVVFGKMRRRRRRR